MRESVFDPTTNSRDRAASQDNRAQVEFLRDVLTIAKRAFIGQAFAVIDKNKVSMITEKDDHVSGTVGDYQDLAAIMEDDDYILVTAEDIQDFAVIAEDNDDVSVIAGDIKDFAAFMEEDDDVHTTTI